MNDASPQKIFLATGNDGKAQRFKKLLGWAGLDIEVYTPRDFGLENIDPVENGKTLAENAITKARAYLGKVDMPIRANDTGFWVEGDGLVNAPKRAALGKKDEKITSTLSTWQTASNPKAAIEMRNRIREAKQDERRRKRGNRPTDES